MADNRTWFADLQKKAEENRIQEEEKRKLEADQAEEERRKQIEEGKAFMKKMGDTVKASLDKQQADAVNTAIVSAKKKAKEEWDKEHGCTELDGSYKALTKSMNENANVPFLVRMKNVK